MYIFTSTHSITFPERHTEIEINFGLNVVIPYYNHKYNWISAISEIVNGFKQSLMYRENFQSQLKPEVIDLITTSMKCSVCDLLILASAKQQMWKRFFVFIRFQFSFCKCIWNNKQKPPIFPHWMVFTVIILISTSCNPLILKLVFIQRIIGQKGNEKIVNQLWNAAINTGWCGINFKVFILYDKQDKRRINNQLAICVIAFKVNYRFSKNGVILVQSFGIRFLVCSRSAPPKFASRFVC